MKKTVSGIFFSLLLMGTLALALNVQPVKGNTITVPDDYPTIQDAVNAASENDTVFVRNGTYYEHVVVAKTLSLIGENAQSTVIDGGGSLSVVVIGANNVNVSGFTIRNSEPGLQNGGIRLSGASYCNIAGNNIGANNFEGVYLHYSHHNTISRNTIANNQHGVCLDSSSNNTVSGNNITANNQYGVHLYSSSNYNIVSGNNITNNGEGVYLEFSSDNTLSGNSMVGNTYNFAVYGDMLSDFVNDVDVSNTVDGKPIYYLANQKDLVIDPVTFPQVGYLALVNCTCMTVQNLSLTDNWEGILLANTTNSTITKNNITANNFGVFPVSSSNDNTYSGNNITANNQYGVYLGYSSNNTVSGNNITNNGKGVYLDSSSNNTVSGNNITNNYYGVDLVSSSNNTVSGNTIAANNYDGVYLVGSSNNTVSGNNITNNGEGVGFSGSSNNTVSGNNITNNPVFLSYSSNNTVSGNNITNKGNLGVFLFHSSNNTVSENNITNNRYGVSLWASSGNRFFHNNFIDNTHQVNITTPDNTNIWDDGYPSGGNYWSNYWDVDLHSGPYQNETGSDNIWDHPYVINANNRDNYPIIPEFPSAAILPLFMAISIIGLALSKKRNKNHFTPV